MNEENKFVNFIKREWFILFLIITSFIGGFYFNSRLPDILPTHWNFAGEIDGYGPKQMVTFGFPAIALGMYLLLMILPVMDPKRQNYELFKGAYFIIRTIIIAFFVEIFWAIILFGLGYKLDISKIIVISIGILFIVLGNYMGRIRQNYFVGIKTPWTLNNQEIWTKTHRLAGKLWVAAGFTMMITIFINGVLTFAIMMALVTYPVVYSYLLHLKMQRQ